jgi:hypothetical protein
MLNEEVIRIIERKSIPTLLLDYKNYESKDNMNSLLKKFNNE